MDGYIRVSRVGGREGDSFISPDVQRVQIERWAQLRDVRIIAWHTDLDESGARDDRPGLIAALERIEAGATGGLVVAKFDRFARSLSAALDAIKRIDDAGGMFTSVAEGIDPTTAAGKFQRGIFLLLAEFQLDQIRDQWRISREEAVRRGVHVASRTPTGYRRSDSGRLEPDPVAAPVVRQLFERRARGDSWAKLAAFLNATDVRGPYNAQQWTNRSMSHILANRVYLGEARSGEFANPRAHDAIVSRSLWEAAQSARGAPAVRGEPALLAGLVRCAGCRHLLKPDRMTLRSGRRVRTYRCRGGHASGTCTDRVAVLGTVIEPWVERQVLAHAAGLQARQTRDNAEFTATIEAVADAEAELAAFRDNERVLGILGEEGFLAGLKIRAEHVDTEHRALAELRARTQPMGALTADLTTLWPLLGTEEKQRALRAVIDAVVIRSGRSLPIDDRALVFWRGDLPEDWPRRGRRVPFASFEWPRDLPAPAVAVVEDVEEHSLER